MKKNEMSFNNALWITSHFRQGFNREEIQEALDVSYKEITERVKEFPTPEQQEAYAHSWGWFDANRFLHPPEPVVREETEEDSDDE